MKHAILTFQVFVVICLMLPSLLSALEVSHDLRVRLEPARSFLQVDDRITWPDEICSAGTESFRLHAGLSPVVLTPGVELKKNANAAAGVPVEIWQLRWPSGVCTVDLKYMGVIDHPPQSEMSPGTISEEGVFLGGSTAWYPMVADQLVRFRMQVSVSAPWRSVSQGEMLSSREKDGRNWQIWQEQKPQDDIYLIAAHFHYYSRQGNNYLAEAWLRSPDEELAEKYLEATLGYLEMYDGMIGPYPYSKFSLVENFWATGYGMPSFTLLGSSVIRLPFLLYTSYPHEVLHNWWGNGVYVDYGSGNWSEGLTSYLADHHLKDLRRQGAQYRRDALNNFASYVNEDNDFPVREFLSRYDKASSAIGYGKVMMLFHMLRVQLGDELFFKGIQRFYQEHLFQRSSYDDIEESFEAVSGKDLQVFFDQWVTRTGAPHLVIAEARVESHGGQWRLYLELRQTQEEEAYVLTVPVQLKWADGSLSKRVLTMTSKAQIWDLALEKKPVTLTVDPDFDVFRHLYPEEVPSSLAQTFGSTEALIIILPSNSPMMENYKSFANSFKGRIPGSVQVVLDSDQENLPESGRIWLMGWESEFIPQLSCLFEQEGVQFSPSQLQLGQKTFEKPDSALVFSFRGNQQGQNSCLGRTQVASVVWTGMSDSTDPLVLGGKMFHYGSYSYIGFDNQLNNQLKGQWRAKSSPLKVEF